ncbi:MAG TPA: hypothetical protein VHW93_10080, partial [Acidimicrobiales bacterium]|nr:hypothetical protein [Acidimicrobiales bacterium]
IQTEFHRNSPSGGLIHNEHTDLLRQASVGLTPEQRAVVDRLPFLDQEVFAPGALRGQYDVLVYSLLMDYTQDRYRHRATGLILPWNQLDVDATDSTFWPRIEAKFGHEGVDRAFLTWFSEQFERIGALTAEQLQDNVRWLAGIVPPGARLILLNGAEAPVDYPGEPLRHLRHEEMNEALDLVVEGLANTTVCDVRQFVVSEDDLSRDIRHYRRYVYVRIAEEIQASAASSLDLVQLRPKGRAWRRIRRVAGRVRRRFRPVDPQPFSTGPSDRKAA